MRLGVARALVDGAWVEGDVEVLDGRVAAVGVGAPRGSRVAAPGFVDLQVNGFAGVDFSAPGEDGYARAGEALLASGVTAFQPTIVTAGVDSMVDSLRRVREVEGGPRLIGVHLEGPFLSPERPGAHDPAAIRAPDLAELERLLDAGGVPLPPAAGSARSATPTGRLPARGIDSKSEAARPRQTAPGAPPAAAPLDSTSDAPLSSSGKPLTDLAGTTGEPTHEISPSRGAREANASRSAPGVVTQVTLAPELPGALELVDALVARGIVVSLGHTEADAATAHAAFDRGAAAVTHVFNAMRRPSPRDPGVAFAALGRDDVFVTAIVDGRHLATDTVRTAWRAAGDRFVLVSDAVAATDAPDGEYTLGGRVPIHSESGTVRTADGALAGTTLTMLAAVRNLHVLGIPLAAALRAATEAPARMARRPALGRIAPGAAADLVVLDDSLDLDQVFLHGAPIR